MAINITRLFTCLGKVVGGLNEWNVGHAATLSARVSTLRSQFSGINGDLEDTLSTNQATARVAGLSWTQYLGTQVLATIQAEVLNDRPFNDTSTAGLLSELRRQMLISADSLATATCTTAVAASGVPVGDPRIVTSDLDPVTGGRSDFLIPDVVLLAAQGNGVFSLTGNLSYPASDPLWPGGAGVLSSIAQTDPATTSAGTDPGFDQWTSSTVPTNWTVADGAVARNADTPDGSIYSCQFTGTGALIRIRQAVSATPGSVLAVHFDAKKTASPANTGTLVVRLEDAAGNALSGSVTVNVATVTGSWVGYTGNLWVPTTATGTIYLAFRYTGGVGDVCRVDRLSAYPTTALYTAGLNLTVFKGITASLPPDAWTLTTTSDSGALTASLLRGIDRLAGVSAFPVRIPTSGAPTQSNALVS